LHGLTLGLALVAARIRAAEPEPRPDEQKPAPYLAVPPPEHAARNIDLGVTAGAVWRSASSNATDYPATFAYGAALRLEISEWLGVRAFFQQSSQSVEFSDPTRAHQPDLDVLLLGLRIEPSLTLMPRLRGWAGASAGWIRTVMPPADGSATRVRLGTGLDLGVAVGAGYDVIADRLAVTGALGASWIVLQSGDMFRTADAIDASGARATVAGLPEYGAALHAELGLEVTW
jgi:hypothetical protein